MISVLDWAGDHWLITLGLFFIWKGMIGKAISWFVDLLGEKEMNEGLEKYRIKPPRRDMEGDEVEDTHHEEDDMEEHDEPTHPETYRGKYICSNCGAKNEDDVPWGDRIDETTFECPHCGCET